MIRKLIFLLIILGFSAVFVFLGINTFFSKEKIVEYNGKDRSYRLHLPKNYSDQHNYPLVIVLHGTPDNPRIIEMYSGWSRKADKEGFIVVYPYGTRSKSLSAPSWNSKFCCGDALSSNEDDVGFISLLIDKLKDEYSVDGNKVYVTGFSNGAMMTNILGVTLSEKVTAIATVAGSVGGRVEDSDEALEGEVEKEYIFIDKSYKSIPVIIFHGRNDRSVPFEGGIDKKKAYNFAGAYDSVNFWLENNACDKHPAQIEKKDEYTKEVYNGCEGNGEIVFFAVNSGHVWPGGAFEVVKVLTRKSVSATNEIWDFFSTH